MSSLAGALASPTIDIKPLLTDNHVPESISQSNLTQDVDMKPADAEDEKADTHEDEGMGDLFGEERDIDFVKHEQELSAPSALDTKSPTPISPPPPDGLTALDRKQRQALEYEEEEEPNPVVHLEASVNIPNIPVPQSSDSQHWVIRTPNFVKVDSKPFHPDTYIGPEQEDEDLRYGTAAHDRDMGIKLRVENTVRWRWVKDEHGRDRRQSNARIVRWSDGSLSLRLGKEYFDMSQVIDTSGSAPRHALGIAPSSSQTLSAPTPALIPTPPSQPTKSQGLTYLVAQHKRAEILQAEALITGYMTLRPTDMQSETHRLLVRAVGQKHNKVARLRMAPDPHTDPEREKQELMRQAAKKPRRVRGEDELFGGSAGRRRRGASMGTRRRSGDDMWSDDEDEAEFDGSEEGDEDGAAGGSRPGKRRRPQETEGRRGGEYQTDDFLVADSDEEGHGSDEGAHGRRRRRHKNGEEEDPLDKLENKISQQAAAERRRRRDDGPADDGAVEGGRDAVEGDEGERDEEMDVESEEDEEFRVRRAGGGTRKRRIDLDEEDE